MIVQRSNIFRIRIARDWNSLSGRLNPVGVQIGYWILRKRQGEWP